MTARRSRTCSPARHRRRAAQRERVFSGGTPAVGGGPPDRGGTPPYTVTASRDGHTVASAKLPAARAFSLPIRSGVLSS